MISIFFPWIGHESSLEFGIPYGSLDERTDPGCIDPLSLLTIEALI